MRLLDAGQGDAVAAMARRAAELLGIVDLQQLAVRMADEGLLASHGCFGQRDRLAYPHVAGFAAIH